MLAPAGVPSFSRHLKDLDEEQNQKNAPYQDQKSEKTEEEQTGRIREITLNYELGLREELALEEKTGRDHSN